MVYVAFSAERLRTGARVVVAAALGDERLSTNQKLLRQGRCRGSSCSGLFSFSFSRCPRGPPYQLRNLGSKPVKRLTHRASHHSRGHCIGAPPQNIASSSSASFRRPTERQSHRSQSHCPSAKPEMLASRFQSLGALPEMLAPRLRNPSARPEMLAQLFFPVVRDLFSAPVRFP